MNEENIIKLTIKTVKEYDEQQRLKNNKSRHDRRLHNTKLLMDHYSLFRKHCDESVYSLQQALENKVDNAIDILDALEQCQDSVYIQSIKNSVTRTYVILSHIDEMLKLYKIYCESSNRPEDQRRYRIMRYRYFDKIRIADICEREGIDESTYYRDSREINERLSSLIFGIDGLS